MSEAVIKSRAKINFGLNIVEKREDGFHNIETIFYPLELHDIIKISDSDNFSFHCDNKSLEDDPSNLVIKAVKALEKKTGKSFKVKIELKKNIPIGAGLGGGSSNAAAVLTSLNSIFNLGLNKDELQSIALQLGSDVPFFLFNKPLYAEGQGEIFKEVLLEISKPILIVNPGIHINTKWAYENSVPKRPEKNLLSLDLISSSYSHLNGIVKNDFEEIVFSRYPGIGEIKSSLIFDGAEFALMSGSGSTIFAIFPNRELALKSKLKFHQKYFVYLQ